MHIGTQSAVPKERIYFIRETRIVQPIFLVFMKFCLVLVHFPLGRGRTAKESVLQQLSRFLDEVILHVCNVQRPRTEQFSPLQYLSQRRAKWSREHQCPIPETNHSDNIRPFSRPEMCKVPFCQNQSSVLAATPPTRTECSDGEWAEYYRL